MGLSKTEINLWRLLLAAPRQQNHAKLIHYVSTLREQLEQLAEERNTDGIPRLSKAMINDYSEKIEAVGAILAPPLLNVEIPSPEPAIDESPRKEGSPSNPTAGLRRRLSLKSKSRNSDCNEADQSSPVKLDAAAHDHTDKHRKMQEDLTDEMVGLAKQLKESSLLISQSVRSTDKILDSTEKAIEHSFASTSRANINATQVNSQSFKTTCLTWLLIFVMTLIFTMVVLLIKVT